MNDRLKPKPSLHLLNTHTQTKTCALGLVTVDMLTGPYLRIRQECQSIRCLLQRIHKQENNKQSKHIRWPVTDLTSHSRPWLDLTLKSSIRKVSLRKERMKERIRKGQWKRSRLGEEKKRMMTDKFDLSLFCTSSPRFQTEHPDNHIFTSFLSLSYMTKPNKQSTLF